MFYNFSIQLNCVVYNMLLLAISSEQTKDEDQLKVQTIEYNNTVKHLECLVTKGKRLLTLMQICRKYETQEEKVIPFVCCTEVELTSSSQQVSALPYLDAIQVDSTFINTWRKS